MRKRIFAWSAVVVAAIATLSCQKEANFVAPENEEGVTIHVLADDAVTKTAAVDGETPTIQWSEGDKIKIYEIVDDVVGANAESDEAVISAGKASFTATLSGSAQGASFKYSAVYPASAVDKSSGNNPFYRIKMPKEQTLKGNNFSEDSDLLFSTVLDHGSSRVANNESVQFSFRRLGTVVRLQLVGITAGEKIQKVTLTAPVNMAGRVKYDPITGTISDAFYDSSTNSKVITLTVSDELVATGNDVVWFRVIAERDWGEENDKIGVEVETDKANYYRNGQDAQHALIDSPVIKFKDGGLTKFGFNLASYRVEKPSATVYTKVTDASEIADGGQYLVTSFKSPKTFAMGSYTAANNPYYSAVEVTENEGSIAISSEPVTIITLEDAGEGAFYIKVPGDESDQYLYWSAGNSVARADKGATDAFKWTVTPTGISNFGTPARMLQYNSGSPRFACYTTNQTAIQLYANSSTVTPVPVNTITLEDVVDGNKIYLDAVGGVAYFTVTTDADWTTNVNIENGDFSIDPESGAKGSTEIEVSADEDNTGAERQMGTITITCGNATETVYVIQNAGASAPAPAGSGTWDDPYNVAKALELIDALANNGYSQTEVYVAGTVTAISDFSVKNTDNPNGYGNASYTIASGNGSVTVFRGKNFNGGDFTDENQLAVNDEVIVYGKLQKYVKNNDVTPEIAQNNYLFARNGEIHLAKPVVTIATDNNAKTITASWNAVDGATSYNVTCGNESKTGLTATSWTFTMSAYGTYDVQVTAKGANGVVDGVSDVKQAELIDPNSGNAPAPAGSGTWEDPYNVAKALELIDALDDGGYSATSVYVAGTVTAISDFSVKNTDNPNGYGNATYTIASGNGSVTVFRGKNFNGSDFTDENQLAVNDEVIVYGKLQKYVKNNDVTPEIAQNNYLFARNGEIHLAKPAITLQLNHDAKTITANWNAVDGATSYDVTCDTQSKTGLTATSWTFTMSAYGTYDVQVTAKGGNGAVDGVSDVYHATLIDPNAGGSNINPIVINSETQGLPTAYGSKNAFDDATLEGYAFKIQQVYVNGQKIQWRAAGNASGTGTMYNADAMPAGIASIVIEYDSSDNNKNLTVQMGSSANPATANSVSPGISGTTYTFNGDGVSKYFVITNGSGAGYVKSITINFN